MKDCLALLGCELEWPIILSNRLQGGYYVSESVSDREREREESV